MKSLELREILENSFTIEEKFAQLVNLFHETISEYEKDLRFLRHQISPDDLHIQVVIPGKEIRERAVLNAMPPKD